LLFQNIDFTLIIAEKRAIRRALFSIFCFRKKNVFIFEF